MLFRRPISIKQHNHLDSDEYHVFRVLKTKPQRHRRDARTDQHFPADIMSIKTFWATRLAESTETGGNTPGSHTQGLVLTTDTLYPSRRNVTHAHRAVGQPFTCVRLQTSSLLAHLLLIRCAATLTRVPFMTVPFRSALCFTCLIVFCTFLRLNRSSEDPARFPSLRFWCAVLRTVSRMYLYAK